MGSVKMRRMVGDAKQIGGRSRVTENAIFCFRVLHILAFIGTFVPTNYYDQSESHE